MRRLAPRALSVALEGIVADAAPATPLARVQGVWGKVAGAGLAAHATPLSEASGVVTVACESAVWAQELELLSRELQGRLDAELGAGAVAKLRFVVGSVPNHP